MLALFAPAMLLLGAVTAQVTPSVVTFMSISPVPTTEEVFTIQTSMPGSPGFSTSTCYEVCIMPPCHPCGVTSDFSEGSMGIPAGETPIPSSLLSSLLSNITTGSVSGTPSASSAGTPASFSRTPPAQQSTAAASSSLLQGDRTPLTLALAVSGLVLVGGTFILL